jgi:hypothetical protein
MCVSIYTNKYNLQHLNNGFNKSKVDGSTQTNSLNHSSIIAKHWVAYVSIYFNKCKMELMSNGTLTY